MKYFILLLLLISCEPGSENNANDQLSDRGTNRDNYKNAEFAETYNLNGNDYDVKDIDMSLPENYTHDLYKKYTDIIILDRDDGEEKITLALTYKLKEDLGVEVHTIWETPRTGKTRASIITFTGQDFTLCHDEVVEVSSFRKEYEEICDEFGSVK